MLFPLFIKALVGDKYGYRPIPSCIAEDLFIKLQTAAGQSVDSDMWSIVEEWYLRDSNSLPAVYMLQAISSKIQHYNNVIIYINVKLTIVFNNFVYHEAVMSATTAWKYFQHKI